MTTQARTRARERFIRWSLSRFMKLVACALRCSCQDQAPSSMMQSVASPTTAIPSLSCGRARENLTLPRKLEAQSVRLMFGLRRSQSGSFFPVHFGFLAKAVERKRRAKIIPNPRLNLTLMTFPHFVLHPLIGIDQMSDGA